MLCSVRDAFGEAITFIKQASATAGLHYPERCQMIVICNCPAWFHQLWRIIKAFIAPVTLEKIRILKAGAVFPELSLHIDPENIPPGKDECAALLLSEALIAKTKQLTGSMWLLDAPRMRKLLHNDQLKAVRRVDDG